MGMKGLPFPGQKEVSEVDVIVAQAGGSAAAAHADEATKAALAAAAAKELAEKEANKSWFEKLQPYLLPIGIALAMQTFMGGAKEQPAAAAAGGSAAAGSRRAAPAR
jgi:hypothetical protein